MADTLFPALAETRMLPLARIRRERTLPTRGEVIVSVGSRLGALDVVARSHAAGHLRPVPLARYMHVTEQTLPKYMVKQVGEEIQPREIIASKPEWFGTLRRVYRAPGAGYIVALQGSWLAMNLADAPFELIALYRGSVVSVMPRLGVVIEATGALVQGVWGIGREGYGVLKKLVDAQDAILTGDKIDVNARGAILLAGAGITEEALQRAVQEHVAGLIVGGLSLRLKELLATLTLPTLVTEGLGEHAMPAPIFELLAAHSGDEALINTRTGARPEVFIPALLTGGAGETAVPPSALVAEIGAPVRIVAGPRFGEIGKIAEVPTMPRTLESGMSVWGAEIELGQSSHVFVPWENLELIG